MLGAIVPLLELALTESNAQGAYLYSVDLRNDEARILLWAGLPPVPGAAPAKLEGPAVKRAFGRTTPQVLHEQAWRHPAFEELIEFRENQFEGVISIPLLESAGIVGVLNVCRSKPASLKPREFSLLLRLGAVVSALLGVSRTRLDLERDVERLTRELADRKLLDRAKGLIQSRFESTEEQAYFYIRNLSRRRRKPMRQIAEEVIHTGASRISAVEVVR
jgi:uroporphyrinogen-III synthase